MDLSGKTVIVTGAASGIGRATASDLQRRGAVVIGVDRNPTPEANESFEVDLSDPGSIDDLVSRLPEGADGLCNIAGVPPTMPGELVLKVNFLGLRRLTLGLVDRMADGASIVNLASMAGNGWRDNIGQVMELLNGDYDAVNALVERYDIGTGARSYFLSKEAVIVWTMEHRWTWRSRGIRMNCVSPGPVETPALEAFIETLGRRAMESIRNMDRFGRPEDVTPTVAFLLSDDAAWYCGANLTPDGGMGSHLELRRYGPS